MSHEHHHEVKTLANDIFKATEVKVAKCYQCGKCSAGCPVSEEMDLPPNVLLRLLQTDNEADEQTVLKSKSIWLCLTCEMCISRCPMDVELPKVMDFLRQKSLSLNLQHPEAKKIIDFHKAFLDSIEYTGRLYELGLVVDYKVRSKDLVKDVMLAPKMISRGKLGFLPEMIKNKENMKRIFSRTKKTGGK